MIDVENVIFNQIANDIQTDFPGALVVSDYIDSPSSFPCVSIVEENNSTYLMSLDNTHVENHANLLYSVNVYSNLSYGAKEEAKKILNLIDEKFQELNFNRTFRQPIPNANRSIYRLTARYTAVVSKAIENNGNTSYTLYRK